MKSIRIWEALAVSALVAVAAPAVAASDISGTWNTSFDSQVGKQTYT